MADFSRMSISGGKDDLEQRLVDHIAKTAVGARLADIADFVTTATPQQLALIETEMHMARQEQPMHTFDYHPLDPLGG
jgi:hypothetical protein